MKQSLMGEIDIQYKIDVPVTPEQFIELLRSTSLGERRPTEDIECIEGMLNNSDLTISAWHDAQLVGIARSLTDFHYACYLSDLAVHEKYQRLGIGKQLQKATQKQLGPHCKLILIAAPSANSYYPQFGYTHNDKCWILERDQPIE